MMEIPSGLGVTGMMGIFALRPWGDRDGGNIYPQALRYVTGMVASGLGVTGMMGIFTLRPWSDRDDGLRP